MKVRVILEQRFERTPDGTTWTRTMFAYPFWQRYLEVFDGVGVVARIRDTPTMQAGWQRADGERVTFCIVPDYQGPWQYLQRSGRVGAALRDVVRKD